MLIQINFFLTISLLARLCQSQPKPEEDGSVDQGMQCGQLSQQECDLQMSAHNVYGFNFPYLSDAPASYPKYPSDTWRDPECNVMKKCPRTMLRDPLNGIDSNITQEIWNEECRNARFAVNCSSAWATKCLPEYFKERKDFIIATHRYYDAICSAPETYASALGLGQCFHAIMQSTSGAALKSCSDNLSASMQKSATARGPNLANRWTSGTVIKEHCCQVKQRQNCLTKGNAEQVCGSQVVQRFQGLFDATYSAFQCSGLLAGC